MTIKELIDDLSRFPDDARVVFTPKDCTGGGWPEWSDAFASNEVCERWNDSLKDYRDEATGAVIVTLAGEIE